MRFDIPLQCSSLPFCLIGALDSFVLCHRKGGLVRVTYLTTVPSRVSGFVMLEVGFSKLHDVGFVRDDLALLSFDDAVQVHFQIASVWSLLRAG